MDNIVAGVATPDADVGHPDSAAIVERVRSCLECIRREFDGWDDPHAQGPGLYFVIEADAATVFSEPMGAITGR